MVGTATHIPIHLGASGSSNFPDVMSSNYNLSIAEYNEGSHSEERRVETLLGQSSLHDGGNEVSYSSGHSHSHNINQDTTNVDEMDRRYSNPTGVSTSNSNPHQSEHHQGQQQPQSILADADHFPDTFHAEFITQPLDYPIGGSSPPLAVSILSTTSAHVPPGASTVGGPRACHPSSFQIGGGLVGNDYPSISIGPSIKSVSFDEGSHPSDAHSRSPPSPSSSPCGAGVPLSPHSPSHILPSFIDTYNLPPTLQQHQHGNVAHPSTTILAHRQSQYAPMTPTSTSSINGGNRNTNTSIPRHTTLESRFTMFKTEPNTSPSPQPCLNVGNITYVQSQHSQPNQLVSTPSTSPSSPYITSSHSSNLLSYHPQQPQGQGSIGRGSCSTYEPPSLQFLKKVLNFGIFRINE